MRKLEKLNHPLFKEIEEDKILGATYGGSSDEIGTCSSKCADIRRDGKLIIVGCI